MSAEAVSDDVRAFVSRLVEACDRDDIEEEAERLAKEAQGYRLVDGGQESDGMSRVYDYRTRALLTEMPDKDYPVFMDRAWPDDWWHVDPLRLDDPRTSRVPADGLPAGLAEALTEWVFEHIDEARSWIGGKA